MWCRLKDDGLGLALYEWVLGFGKKGLVVGKRSLGRVGQYFRLKCKLKWDWTETI